jgi:putative oxidoreductase
MKIVVLIARILLGLIFVVFGSNIFLQFFPTPPMPAGPIKDFSTVMMATHYMQVVGFFQVLGGLLLFIPRFVPLGLTILAAILVNILATHLLVMHGGLFPIPILCVLLWLLIFWRYRSAFAGILGAESVA